MSENEVTDVSIKGGVATEKKKRGIIQSRGLGDIIIALPIAKEYYDAGEEIVWPIREEFLGSLQETVPWVQWKPMSTDQQGKYFVETPLQVFKYNNVSEQEALYLYHYLNSQPQMTDPELFNILKFDQYKYQVAGVSFLKKWTLASCITRNAEREAAFKAALFGRLGIGAGDRYAVVHLEGSTFTANIRLDWIDPDVKVVHVNKETMSDNVFDWLSVLEGAEIAVCVDSVIANLIDCMQLKIPDLYWIRRSGWDLTPVMGLQWTVIATDLPIKEAVRVDPAAQARELFAKIEAAKKQQEQRAQPPAQTMGAKRADPGSVTSHVPFQAKGAIPKSFLDKVKPLTVEQAAQLNGGGRSRMPQNTPANNAAPQTSKAQELYKSLGMGLKM